MYKYLKDLDNSNRSDFILRISDNAWIANDSKNRDWKEYQAWLALGNTPLASE